MSEHIDCRWNGSDKPRTLPNRHEDQCGDDRCRGCQPCTEPHCRVCGRTHAAGACAECLAEVRANLREIGRLCDALPEEVEHRGVEGEAMMLLGPSADPEARQHVEAAYLAGRLPEGWIEAGHGKFCPRVRNEPCTGCAGGELHPMFVLGTWDMVWRDALEHTEEGALTLPLAVDYLDRQMTYMAEYPHVPFEDFARDLRRCVGHLEAVLHDGEQIERGAPCPDCGKTLEHTYGKRIIDDRWVCPSQRCGVSYTTGQYRGWVEEDARNEASRLTAADMALRFTTEDFELKASVVRVWGARGAITKRGRNDNGMWLYDVADVEARLAEQAKSA